MFDASNPSADALWSAAQRRAAAPRRDDAALLFPVLRFAAHLPYFKIAAALLLPQGLGTAGVLVSVLAYALACSAASRWIAAQRRGRSLALSPAVLPLLGTTATLIAMLVIGPVIATLLPRHADAASMATLALLPAWLAMLTPPLALFFTAQLLTAPRTRTI